MKKITQPSLLLMFVFTVLSSSLFAQSRQEDMMMLAKKYETAYNKHDVAALKAMYTTDAIENNADGSVITGNEAIGASIAADFNADKSIMLSVKQEKTAKNSDDSFISSGTYHLTGTDGTGKTWMFDGTYTNTEVNDNGTWKISKSVLAEMKK